MKKIALLSIIILILTSASAQLKKIRHITLNGIDSSTATRQIKCFKCKKEGDLLPKKTCVWFSKDEVNDIVDLLNSEISAQKGAGQKTDTTDGIRIYFRSTVIPHSQQLENKIALVSTKYNLKYSQKFGYDIHQDYYYHLDNKLFTLTDHEGKSTHDNCGGGAVLYTPCVDETCTGNQTCPYTTPHALKRNAVERMVRNFAEHEVYRRRSMNTYAAWFDMSFWQNIRNDTKHTGIRVYFGTHSADESDTKLADRDTFVITTTGRGTGTSSNIDTDYFDCQPAPKPKIKKYFKKDKNHPVMIKYLPGQDKGELCPDNCNVK